MFYWSGIFFQYTYLSWDFSDTFTKQGQGGRIKSDILNMCIGSGKPIRIVHWNINGLLREHLAEVLGVEQIDVYVLNETHLMKPR